MKFFAKTGEENEKKIWLKITKINFALQRKLFYKIPKVHRRNSFFSALLTA
jgi:hypothetical protein